MSNLLINESDKFVKYKYSIAELYIITDGVSEAFPLEKISGFKIENHFADATFPIFRITLLMNELKYYDMIKYKDKVKFKLRIQCYQTDMDETHKSMLKDVVNDIFVFFPEESNANYDRGRKTKINEKKDPNKLENSDDKFDLFLFKDEIVNGIRSSMNAVLTNCTMTSAVTYLLGKAGVTETLMSPFDNDIIYPNIVLPPQSIESQLKYLNNNYGFHKEGTIIFFGLSHSYVIRCNGLCTAWLKNETRETVIYILEKNDSASMASSNIQKHGDSRNYVSTSIENINISESSASANVIGGLDADIVSVSNNKVDTVNFDSCTVGNVNKKVIFDDSSNMFMKSIYSSIQYSNTISISIVLEDLNISAFNPNKAISIIFESSELNMSHGGRYRISSSIFTFSGPSSAMKVNGILTLKKINNKIK